MEHPTRLELAFPAYQAGGLPLTYKCSNESGGPEWNRTTVP